MKRLRTHPEKGSRAYRQLWRIVDGAVADAFLQHPDYLTPRRRRAAQNSVTKRVVGGVLGWASQEAQGRSALVAAADKASPVVARRRARRPLSAPEGRAEYAVSPDALLNASGVSFTPTLGEHNHGPS